MRTYCRSPHRPLVHIISTQELSSRAECVLIMCICGWCQILSNGTFKSVLHRATANNTVGRYSVPNFFVPSKDTVMEPLKELISETNPAVYRSLTFEEYIKGFFSKPLAGVRHIDQFKIIK